MLEWAFANNVISSLCFNGVQLIKPWGVETADSSAFFSLEDGVGYRYQVLASKQNESALRRKLSLEVRMQEGRWTLDVEELLQGDSVVRTCVLRCLEDSWFLDFVLRFRFLKKEFPLASIAGQTVFHSNSNIYYQYPVTEATLHGKQLIAHVKVVEVLSPLVLQPLLYVRDRDEEWVVHARMLPEGTQRKVIKVCNGWAGTRPLPALVSRLLLKNKTIEKKLMYRSEHAQSKSLLGRLVNLNAYKLVQVKQGEVLRWTVSVEIKPVVNI